MAMSPMAADQVTVFIPLKHYHEGFLRQAIDSLIRQSRADWRLLIVVEASTCSHFERLLSEPLADARLRLVVRSGRRLAGAYNSAMRAAETDFLAPLLGDDLWSPDAVAVLGDAIRAHPHVDFFHSGRQFIDAHNRPLGSVYLPTTPVTAETFVDGSPVKHLLCWRASMGLACGGVDEAMDNFASDDYDFPWRMLEYGARFHAIPKPLYLYRDHREGYRLTTHVPRSVQEHELRRILEKHGVADSLIRARLRTDRRGYLKQSLFRNYVHRWFLERVGFDAHRGWREPYR